MIILGIDPGTARTGFGYISVSDGSNEFIDCGCITTSKETAKGERLAILYKELTSLLKNRRPDVMVVEQLFFNKNTLTALTVGEARGVILLAATLCGIPVTEYTPLQVKECLSGYGRATKQEVKEMVKIHLCLEKIKGPDDVADALAISLCHSFNLSMGECIR